MGKARKIFIEPSKMFLYDDCLYYYQSRYGLIIKLDVEKKACAIVVDVTKCCGNISEVLEIICCDNKLFLIPQYKNCICTYNMVTGETGKIFFEHQNKDKEIFVGAFLWENKIYCVPATDEKMLIVDCVSESVETEDIYFQLRNEHKEPVLLSHLQIQGDCIWGNLYEKNVLFCYNLTEKSATTKKLNNPRNGIYTSFAVFDKDVFVYDREKKVIDKYELENFNLLDSCHLKNKLYRISRIKDRIFADSLYDSEIIIMEQDFSIVKEDDEGSVSDELCVGCFDQEKKYYFNLATNYLYKVDDLFEQKFCFGVELDWSCRNKSLILNDLVKEKEKYDLRQFLQEI